MKKIYLLGFLACMVFAMGMEWKSGKEVMVLGIIFLALGSLET